MAHGLDLDLGLRTHHARREPLDLAGLHLLLLLLLLAARGVRAQ
jgi:hypothetical protein